MAYGVGSAHHRHAIAVLQHEVVGGKQLYVATHHTADVHTVGLAQMQCAEHLAVEHSACHHYDAALDVRVYRVPVYLFAVPVLLHLLSKQYFHGVGLVARGHHQHVVAAMELGMRHRHDDLLASPHARDDEFKMCHACHLGYGLAHHGRVYHHILCYVRVVGIGTRRRRQVGGAHDEAAYRHHGYYHTHHTERIGHGTTQRCAAARQSMVLQRLLRRTESGRVGGGTAQYAHHVGHADRQHIGQRHCHECAHGNDSEAPQVELYALLPHQCEEVGTDI